MKISIIIKTLNEEPNIARAIESALAASAPHVGEVLVADGGSTDLTIKIAMQYPVEVVQLGVREQQCCGIGPQLGYQHCKGEYIYILDGDMELDAGFIHEAIGMLDRDPTIGGVGGLVNEKVFANIEFKSRARHFFSRQLEHGCEVDCLTGGGLYRRAAIQEVSYFSDRNLHGFEEYDLGARLRSRGWRVIRLESRAVDHYSHPFGTYALLWHRLRGGRLLAVGEIVRAGIACGYLKRAVVELRPIRFAIGMLAYWPAICFLALTSPSLLWTITIFGLAVALPVAAMTVRSRSAAAGIYSVVVWHLTSIMLLLGLMRSRTDPTTPIRSVVLRTASDDGREGNIRPSGAIALRVNRP